MFTYIFFLCTYSLYINNLNMNLTYEMIIIFIYKKTEKNKVFKILYLMNKCKNWNIIICIPLSLNKFHMKNISFFCCLSFFVAITARPLINISLHLYLSIVIWLYIQIDEVQDQVWSNVDDWLDVFFTFFHFNSDFACIYFVRINEKDAVGYIYLLVFFKF